MTNETIAGLKRISWLPDRDALENGTLIGGQEYYDVDFTGGTITGVAISGLPAPLPIADGGTGQSTANAALNALLPSQSGQSGKVLSTNGANASWASDVSGITQLTGDGTAGPGSGSQVFTLSTVNSNVGTFGSATQAPQLTVNGKGLITAVSSVTITPAASSVTGGAALTRTNDTNVTATLGGTPTTALLTAASITLGWTGLLAGSRGGTNNGFTEFTGPATSTKIFTLPNASSTILTTNAAVTVAQGGTGLTTLTAGSVIVGNGTSNPTFVAPGAAGNALLSNGTAWTSAPVSTLATAQTTTSGTSKDFTSIPAGTKRIMVIFNSVSLNGTANLLVQIGDSGGIENTGYVSSGEYAATNVTSTAGYIIKCNSAADATTGILTLCHVGGNLWIASGVLRPDAAAGTSGVAAGTKTLSAELDRLRLTTTNGTDTFDNGSINIIYE